MDKNIAVPRIQTVIDECVPLLKSLAKGRCAVTIGGSHGKGTFDERSDVDFRVFCDEIVGAPHYWETEEWKVFAQAVEHWRGRGINIDYCWFRSTGEIESQLDAWLGGQIQPVEMVWSLWGYHFLTDIASQMVLDDPSGLIATWQERLSSYPQTLQRAILEKHIGSLQYWRSDYHYQNKVERGDVFFLASIAPRLVYDMLQVLFAINKTYYVGDGNNLSYVATFPVQPRDFAERIRIALYPPSSEKIFKVQYEAIIGLIDDISELATKVYNEENAVKIKSAPDNGN